MFGRIKKAVRSWTSPKKNSMRITMGTSSLSQEEVSKALRKLKIPTEIQEAILSELPNVIEQIDEATKQIYDPNTIWLEAIQFADYIEQLGKHLREPHGDDCVADIAEQVINMANSFKDMGESALRVIDETEDMHG